MTKTTAPQTSGQALDDALRDTRRSARSTLEELTPSIARARAITKEYPIRATLARLAPSIARARAMVQRLRAQRLRVTPLSSESATRSVVRPCPRRGGRRAPRRATRSSSSLSSLSEAPPPQPPPTSRYLSAVDVAEELGISRSRAYEIIQQCPRLIAGRTVRVRRSDLERWIRQHEQNPITFAPRIHAARTVDRAPTRSTSTPPDAANRVNPFRTPIRPRTTPRSS